MPAAEVGSRSTAARVTRGESCLSNSTHFPLMLYSKLVKPVALPPGRARLWINPAPTGSATFDHDDRDGAGCLQQRRDGHAADAHDHVRSKRNQVRGGPAQPVRIATGEAKIDLQVATDHPAQLLEALLEHRFARRGLDVAGEERHDHADAPYPARLLCGRGRRGAHKRSRRRASDQTEEFAAIPVTVIIRESG